MSEIDLMKKQLDKLSLEFYNDLTNPVLVEKSQELDILIVEKQKLLMQKSITN